MWGSLCSRNTAYTYKVATIRCSLISSAPTRPGDHQECLLILLTGLAHLSTTGTPDRTTG